MKYIIPEEHFFRLHHVRPRFKNDVENVLFYMSNELSQIPTLPKANFIEKVNSAIKLFPSNLDKTEKTINNWRTEISALFGLISNNSDGTMSPSPMAKLLADNQDLIEFFRYFLYYFQYPGGHLKPQEIAGLINSKIKFKPAKFILALLDYGETTTSKRFGIDKAEATHCIFNDLRVTTGEYQTEDVFKLIEENKKVKLTYDWEGDVIRYAGDILDYLVLADLLILQPNNKYYLNKSNYEVIQAFIKSSNYFDGYNSLYNNLNIEEKDYTIINQASFNWFKYVNTKLSTDLFSTDLTTYLQGVDNEVQPVHALLAEVLKDIFEENELRTKKIGDTGEAIIYRHEKQRLINIGGEQFLPYVQKIPSQYAVGYDIQSAEFDGTRRYIEVKTTISKGRLSVNRFHMTPSEWTSAEGHNNRYFVYRLLISKEDLDLFVIQDPVGKYKSNLLQMLPRNGAEIIYNEKSGQWEKLLVEIK